MKNSFGQSVCLTIFGESHGEAVGCVIDGLAPGLAVDESFIARRLELRRPSSALDTPRRERDEFRIISGVFNGRTTGTPLCIVIPNENTRSGDYSYGLSRPSHADYAAYRKYHGFEDYRGGGHFSGRITAALVAAGGVLIPALENAGISLATHIYRCAGVSDRAVGNIKSDIQALSGKSFPVLDDERGEEMARRILDAREASDSVGGVTETLICGTPAGLGEPWFDSVESMIAHAVFSLGGIKGIEFGAGFAAAALRGSENNDAFAVENGKIVTETNRCGGILGGITDGMPLTFRAAVKPTPSIARAQRTVDLDTLERAEIRIAGRHDPCIVPRAVPCIEAAAAIAVYDALLARRKERR